MNSRLIKISKNRIYFTNSFFVSLNQTNFPQGSISFKHHLDIYLEVELLTYDLSKKTLEIKITDYSPDSNASFNSQKLKKPISQLNFRELDWDQLQKLLSSFLYTLPEKIPDAFKKESYGNRFKRKNTDKNTKPKFKHQTKDDQLTKDELRKEEVQEIIHKVNFNVLFSEAQFDNGYVSVVKNFSFIEQPVEFKISNDLIRSEYSYIKNYFLNYFESDSFVVTAMIKVIGSEILSIDCQSKTIEKINEKIIENVKTDRTLNITRIEKNNETEKSTFSADEILSKLDDSSNIFDQNEIDILMTIIESKSPRNIEQLKYLAGTKHEISKKIRFTLSPLFGFIFFITGKEKDHICWELLNSHATYIWSFEKDISIESQIELSELNINTIKKIGRKKYRSYVKNNQLDINSIFNVINHTKSKTVNGFEIWRKKIVAKLI